MAEGGSVTKRANTAFVLGYTGGCGRYLVKALNKHKIFQKVVLIGRRIAELDPSLGPEFEQKVVDFEKLDEHSDVFKDVDTGFCCLGVNVLQVGKSGQKTVEQDYTWKSAEIAKSLGCKYFSVISGMGANANGRTWSSKNKGIIEEGLKKINFDQLVIFRPGAIYGLKREQPRYSERAVQILCFPIEKLFPNRFSVTGERLAEAMVLDYLNKGKLSPQTNKDGEQQETQIDAQETQNDATGSQEDAKVRLYENGDIHDMLNDIEAA